MTTVCSRSVSIPSVRIQVSEVNELLHFGVLSMMNTKLRKQMFKYCSVVFCIVFVYRCRIIRAYYGVSGYSTRCNNDRYLRL